jgi:hypothetical protein
MGIGTGESFPLSARESQTRARGLIAALHIVSTLQLNTAARPDSTPNHVEHRWMLAISVEQDYGLCI